MGAGRTFVECTNCGKMWRAIRPTTSMLCSNCGQSRVRGMRSRDYSFRDHLVICRESGTPIMQDGGRLILTDHTVPVGGGG